MPDSFKDAAAMSADASSLKIAKTTMLFAMNCPSLDSPGAGAHRAVLKTEVQVPCMAECG